MLESTQIIALIALCAAGAAAALWRGAEGRLAKRLGEIETLNAKIKSSESALDKEKKARHRQSEELTELRNRADKAKRRSGRQGAQPLGVASRIQDLEAAAQQTIRERDRLRSERDGLAEELAQLRARIEADARVAKEKEKAQAELAAAPSEEADPLVALEASLAEARERIAKLEDERQTARQAEARSRKRIDTQELLYASLRGELEAKKDRLRTQEEQLQRLQALKVAVLD